MALTRKTIKDQTYTGVFTTERMKVPTVQVLSTVQPLNPAKAIEGDIVFDKLTNTLFYCDGREWRQLVGSSSTGLASILIPDPPRRLHICDSTDAAVNWEPASALPETNRNEIFMHGPNEVLNEYLVFNVTPDPGGAPPDQFGCYVASAGASPGGGYYNGVLSLPFAGGMPLSIVAGNQLNLTAGVRAKAILKAGSGSISSSGTGADVDILGGSGAAFGAGAETGGNVNITAGSGDTGFSSGVGGKVIIRGGLLDFANADQFPQLTVAGANGVNDGSLDFSISTVGPTVTSYFSILAGDVTVSNADLNVTTGDVDVDAGDINVDAGDINVSQGFVDFENAIGGVRYNLVTNSINNSSNTAGDYAPPSGSGTIEPKATLAVTTNGSCGKFTITYTGGAGIGFWEEQRVDVTNSTVTTNSVILLSAESLRNSGSQTLVGVNIISGTIAAGSYSINISSLDTDSVGGTNTNYVDEVVIHYLIVNQHA